MKGAGLHNVIIFVLGALFFIPLLGHFHLFDWDEINFAESSREMLLTGEFFRVTVNFEPFWEKPPLFFWLQSLCMSIFGVGEFAARLPNALFGIATLLTIYNIGTRHFSARFGLIWALLYFGSVLPFLYFKSGIIDPVFNYFIFLSVYFLFLSLHNRDAHVKNAALAGLFSGLAVLTKGPVGLLILLLTWIIFTLVRRFRPLPGWKQIGAFALVFAATTSLWYGAEVIQNGPWFLVEFVKYQVELFLTPVAGHEQPFFYHFVVVFFGCFPLSVLALPSFFKNYETDRYHTRTWMLVLFWVVMILFTIVSTKIAHYSSMAYLPLSFLAAMYMHHASIRIPYVRTYANIIFVVVGILFGILLTALPLAAYQFKDMLLPLMDDPFAVASFSNPDVTWSGAEFLIGVFYLLGVIVAAWFFFNRLLVRGLIVVCFSSAISLMLYACFVVPNIEGYSQGPAIEFFKARQGESVYVTTVGYKSYAHYFYARVQPPNPDDGIVREKNRIMQLFGVDSYNALSQEEKASFNGQVNEWLVYGTIDKPVYFTTKITYPEIEAPGVELMGTDGGFRLYRRLP